MSDKKIDFSGRLGEKLDRLENDKRRSIAICICGIQVVLSLLILFLASDYIGQSVSGSEKVARDLSSLTDSREMQSIIKIVLSILVGLMAYNAVQALFKTLRRLWDLGTGSLPGQRSAGVFSAEDIPSLTKGEKF